MNKLNAILVVANIIACSMLLQVRASERRLPDTIAVASENFDARFEVRRWRRELRLLEVDLADFQKSAQQLEAELDSKNERCRIGIQAYRLIEQAESKQLADDAKVTQ